MADRTVQNATSLKARSRSRAKAISAATKEALSAIAARPGVHLWRPGGELLPQSAVASLIELVETYLDAPQLAVVLDLRHCTLRLTSAQFARCLETVERGFGTIAVPMGVLVKPEDATLMDAAVKRASAAGRFFGVFTSPVSEKRALDWVLELAQFVRPSPPIAQWRGDAARVLAEALLKAMR